MSYNNTKLQEKARYNVIKGLNNELVEQIIAIRIETGRCAEIVWMEAKNRALPPYLQNLNLSDNNHDFNAPNF